MVKKRFFKKSFLIPFLIGYFGLGYLFLNAVHYLTNNQEKTYTSKECYEIHKTDWLLGQTKFERCESAKLKKDTILDSKTFGITKIYVDGGAYGIMDGLVDKIKSDKILIRKKDYNTNKKEFDEASEFLKEIKKRFKID